MRRSRRFAARNDVIAAKECVQRAPLVFAADAVVTVPRKTARVIFDIVTMTESQLELPALEIKASTTPGGGVGVFTTTAHSQGTYLSEYGGVPLSRDDVFVRPRRDLGYEHRDDIRQTHLLSLSSAGANSADTILFGEAGDCPNYRLCDYVARHEVVSFTNATNESQLRNAELVLTSVKVPDPVFPDELRLRAFLRTTRDVAAGEELFWNYYIR